MDEEKVVSEKFDIYKEIFPTEEDEERINSNLRIKFTTKPENDTSINNYINNNGRLNFDEI